MANCGDGIKLEIRFPATLKLRRTGRVGDSGFRPSPLRLPTLLKLQRTGRRAGMGQGSGDWPLASGF
jgi:hypothetical protein